MRCLLLSLCCAMATAAVTVELRPAATIADDVATLGDIARLAGPEEDLARLRSIAVQPLPDAGERSVDADRVRTLIAAELPGLRTRVLGSCTMRRALASFSADDFTAAARADLVARLGELGSDSRLTLRRPAQPVSLPLDRDRPYELVAEALSDSDWGEIPYRVRVLQAGRERRRVLLVFHLQRYREVLVAARELPRGHRLGAADVRLQRLPVRDQATAEAPSMKEAVDCLARCRLSAGRQLTWSLLERPPLVRGGRPVQLVVENDRFSLTVAGVALGDGGENDLINVRPAGGRRIMRGRVVAADRVVIETATP